MIRFGNARVQREEYSISRTEAIEVLKRMHSKMTVNMSVNASFGVRKDMEDSVVTVNLENCENDQALRLAIEHLMRLEVPVQFGFHVAVPPYIAAKFVFGVVALGLGLWFAIHGLGFGWQRQAFEGLDPDSNKMVGAVLLLAGVWILTKVRFW